MPANNLIQAALVPQAVPSDQECVSNLTQVLQGVANFMQVLLTQGAAQGGDSSSVADQALQLAQTALAAAQAAQAAVPQRRSQNTPQSVPTGDSNLTISWAPDMPDDDYELNGTFYGPAGLSAFGGTYYIVDSTRLVTGCTIRLCNVPANCSFAWSVSDLSIT